MTFLRFNEIEIKGRNVRIGGASPDPASPLSSGLHERISRSGLLRALQTSKVPTSVLMGVGVVSIGGGVLLALAGLGEFAFAPMVTGALLTSLGGGVLSLGVAKHLLQRWPHLVSRVELGSRAAPLQKSVLLGLAPAGSRHTVPALAAATQLSPEEVVHALALLRSRYLVVEHLDTDSGEFCYALDSRSPDLDDLLAHPLP